MKRYNCKTSTEVENVQIDAFLEEVVKVCEKHGLSLSHEDFHGAFQVTEFTEENKKWLMDAFDDTGRSK